MTYEIRYTYRLACGTMVGEYGAERYLGADKLADEQANLADALKLSLNLRVTKWATPTDAATKKQIVKITAERFYF